MHTTTLIITGMSCGSCRQHVISALQAVPGVSQVQVDLARGQAEILHATEVAPVELMRAIGAVGYAAHPPSASA